MADTGDSLGREGSPDLLALAQSPGSLDSHSTQLLGIARPCNLVSWTFQAPDSQSAPLQEASPVTELPARPDRVHAAAAHPRVPAAGQQQLVSASFAAGAAWLLLVYPASWHLLQRSGESTAAFTPHAARTAPADALSLSRPLQWQAGLLHQQPGSPAPQVVAWDTAAGVHAGTAPGTASVPLPSAAQPWRLLQLDQDVLAAVPGSTQLGPHTGDTSSALLLRLLPAQPDGSASVGLQLLEGQHQPEQIIQPGTEDLRPADASALCTAALVAGDEPQASLVRVRPDSPAQVSVPAWHSLSSCRRGRAPAMHAPQIAARRRSCTCIVQTCWRCALIILAQGRVWHSRVRCAGNDERAAGGLPPGTGYVPQQPVSCLVTR